MLGLSDGFCHSQKVFTYCSPYVSFSHTKSHHHHSFGVNSYGIRVWCQPEKDPTHLVKIGKIFSFDLKFQIRNSSKYCPFTHFNRENIINFNQLKNQRKNFVQNICSCDWQIESKLKIFFFSFGGVSDRLISLRTTFLSPSYHRFKFSTFYIFIEETNVNWIKKSNSIDIFSIN